MSKYKDESRFLNLEFYTVRKNPSKLKVKTSIHAKPEGTHHQLTHTTKALKSFRQKEGAT